MNRRHFITTTIAAAGALATPAIAQGVQLAPRLMPQAVPIRDTIAPGQLLVVPQQHFLYWTMPGAQAMRYGVGVGRAGLEFKGTATIAVKKEWPTWRPTPEMIERDPDEYARFVDNDYIQPGGPGNPLGARALYLFKNGRDTYFRIHGTTAPGSIGRSVSNGCIRMLNEHVKDLYARVPTGTRVTVF